MIRLLRLRRLGAGSGLLPPTWREIFLEAGTGREGPEGAGRGREEPGGAGRGREGPGEAGKGRDGHLLKK